MQIFLKTLKQQKHALEVQPTDTVAELKRRADEELKLGPVAGQRLIYKGKVLKDEQTVADIGIKPKEFMIFMIKKTRAKKKPQGAGKTEETEEKKQGKAQVTSGTEAKPSPADAEDGKEKEKETETEKAEPTPDKGALTTSAAQSPEPTPPPPGDETIATLMGLGQYSREDVEMALGIANGDTATAAELLLTGVVQEEALHAALMQVAPLVKDVDPHALILVVKGLVRGNPALGRAIRENPQQLVAVLQHPEVLQQLNQAAVEIARERQMVAQQLAMQHMAAQQMAAQQQGAAAGGPPMTAQPQGMLPQGMIPQGMAQPAVIRVTAEEKAEIERITEMLGMPQREVIEAYLVCGRNVELAVNFLLSGGQPDMPSAPSAFDSSGKPESDQDPSQKQ